MKILITGGTGQLGSALGQLLDGRGISYAAPGRDELDITDDGALEAAFGSLPRGQSVTAVIHTAAFTNVDACETERELAFAVNARATERLARHCARRQVPLVYLSTDFIFDGAQKTPYEVDDAPAPLNVYGASKWGGEQAVRRLCDRHYIVRTSWVFGARGRNFPRAILAAAAEGRPLRVVADQRGAPTWAEDLAEVILSLLGTGDSGLPGTAAPYGVYHVTNEGDCSRFEFAHEVVRRGGWDRHVEPIDSQMLGRAARRPAYSVLSLASIDARGLRTRPWRAALAGFLDELQATDPQLFPDGQRSCRPRSGQSVLSLWSRLDK